MNKISLLHSAKSTIETEQQGLSKLLSALDGPLGQDFTSACELIHAINGKVIVAGVGKSGHVGNKIAATMASTGTPAFFVHPAEANHGDLGMIGIDDVVIALSWSGETKELEGIISYTSRFSIPVVAITSNRNSTLGKEATICLELPKVEEACPSVLAPTTSTNMQMAIGDALGVALLEARGFSSEDFSVYHPGGSLGSKLKRISEIMHEDDELPLITADAPMQEAIMTLSDKRFGCVGIIDNNGKLVGIFTDGDLARNLDKNLLEYKIGDLMTRNPKTISKDALANSAMAIMDEHNISAVMVIDKTNKPIGIIHIHDLLHIGAA